jgi:N-acetylmuramidase-like protein/putative peptidoglycan binding protein
MALSADGLTQATGKLGVQAAELWTVLAVETSGCGFLTDRRPQILFERHVFHRLTKGRFDDGDISDSKPGGYGARGAHQYDRLALALKKDRAAALQSASWGVGQIMGENHAFAGFPDVESMVAAMSESEDRQLLAMSSFLIGTRLHLPLQSHDWKAFARGYNGPNYAVNQYDVRLSGEFQKYSTTGLPEIKVRAAQLYLAYLGFDPGRIDGIAGRLTLSALADFRAHKGLPSTNGFDDTALAELVAALDRS